MARLMRRAGLAQVGGRRHRLPPQRPLLHVPRGRPTKDLLFALEELEESQICLWATVYDGAGLRTEGIGEFLRALSEEREATLVPRLDCDGLEGRPRHPLAEVCCEGLVLQTRGPEGSVAGAPGEVGQASAAHIALAELLKMCVDAMLALVLASTVACAADHVQRAEALARQLHAQNLYNVPASFAWAVHDVCEGRLPVDRKDIRLFPELDGA